MVNLLDQRNWELFSVLSLNLSMVQAKVCLVSSLILVLYTTLITSQSLLVLISPAPRLTVYRREDGGLFLFTVVHVGFNQTSIYTFFTEIY